MEQVKKTEVKGRRVVFESKRFLVVEKDMEFPNGEHETWEVVEMKGRGGARTLAILDTNELVFVREYRGAAEKYVLRLPTGVIEEGEEPKAAAKRELQEETGLHAGEMEFLGVINSAGGYYKGNPIHLYVATNVTETGVTQREVGEQDMEVIKIPMVQVYKMIDNVEFEDAETIYALLLLKKYLNSSD